MLNPKFTATVKDGELLMFNPQGFSDYLKFLEGKKIYVVIKKEETPRSNQQNRYYRGVIVKLLSDHTGHSPDEMHEILKSIFLKRWFELETKQGIVRHCVIGSTTDLSTVKMEEFNENIRRWAALELGVNIPEPHQIDFID